MFLKKFKHLGANVFGIDVDEKKVKLAKKITSYVSISYAEKLPFKDNNFDIVWLHEVLEHVDDDRKTIEECFRVLKKGGRLVIFAPNRLWPFETHGIYVGKKYYFGNIPFVTYLPSIIYKRLTPHVRNYFRGDLNKLFKGHSYSVVKHMGVFPGFDKLKYKIPVIGAFIVKLFRFLEKTPLNIFGISHFVVVEKVHA